MSRLILFSGGVESTALLCQADPMDTIITVDATYPYGMNTYRKDTLEQIARKLGFIINYAYIKLPIEPEPYKFVHQFATFVAIAHLWTVKDTSITEVWAGRNQREVPVQQDPTNFKTQQLLAWDFMHPNIPFVHPLEHMTKLEQWNSIPGDIQPLVSSCVTHNRCGRCFKCEEIQKMLAEQ
jgi:7-cyano-7-deazaguanine synthase in queuosine biosynthesis